MVTGTALIRNKSGLHARPASDFVAAATKFDSKIMVKSVENPGQICNAKSIVSLLTLGLSKGATIEISVEGHDEKEALEKLIQMVNDGFGEED